MTVHPGIASAPERNRTREAVPRWLDPHEVHALAVQVANCLLNDALDPAADLVLPERYGLVLLAASVERDGARRARAEPDDGAVLREAVRALAEMERAG